jgi:hypothetical protein
MPADACRLPKTCRHFLVADLSGYLHFPAALVPGRIAEEEERAARTRSKGKGTPL